MGKVNDLVIGCNGFVDDDGRFPITSTLSTAKVLGERWLNQTNKR